MKPLHILLVVLAFAGGVFAANPKVFYYRIEPVDATELDVACTHGRPITAMRLDGLLKVYCFPEQKSRDK